MPDQFTSIALGKKVGWNDDFAKMRAALDAAGMPQLVTVGRRHLDDAERGLHTILGCGGPSPDSGCGLTLRYEPSPARISQG